MNYCLNCPGPLPDDYGGRCPYCGSNRIVEADYCGENGKWYPVKTWTDRWGHIHQSWIKGDWDRHEAARELREMDYDDDGYLPDFEYYDDDDLCDEEDWL